MNSRNNSGASLFRGAFSVFTQIVAVLVLLFIGSAVLAVAVSGLPGFWENLLSKEIRFALRLSVSTATISSLIVLLLALPTAYALTRTNMPFKRLSAVILELTMSLPYILLGLALLIVFSSPFGKWLKANGFRVVFSPVGIVMAHLLVNLPYAIRLVKTAFDSADMRLEFIAETLGASPFISFCTILVPSCRAELISALILIWSRAMGEFGATLMLVGVTRMKTETLPGSIYLNISTGNNEAAMSTAVLILMISALALVLSHLAGKSRKDQRR